jgi:DNA-binding winged helix-turn-helix (wHTH) protein/tetratricopeptide (TPR) repeat protein
MAAPSPQLTFRFGIFEVDTRAGELRKHGLRIKLQDQPFQLLVLLLQRPGQVITREELRHALWSDHTFVDFDRGLNRAVNKLRTALCDLPENPRFIETLHRHGYRFIAPLTVHEQGPECVKEEGEIAAAPPATVSVVSKPASTAGISRIVSYKRPLVWSLAAVLLLFTIIGLFSLYFRSRTALAVEHSPDAAGPRRSVAVLGFKNLSERSDEAWVSTALSDWLTTELSEGGHLRLIPAENVARMKIEIAPLDVANLSSESLTRIRKNLATDLVVLGSYAVVGRNGGDAQIRVDLRLQDARTGAILEAISESGAESHLFDLVLQGGERLRAALGVQPVSSTEAAEVAVALPRNHNAARLYSEGLEELRIFNALGARDLFQQAIAAEPKFALSHSALAAAWATLGYDERAREEAKQAYELSSGLPRADRLLVAARYQEISKQWPRAVEIYRLLFEFFPDSLDYGLDLAQAQLNSGRGQDAIETLNELRKMAPPLGNDARIDLVDARAAESLGDFRTDLTRITQAAEKAQSLGASLLLAQARADQSWALTNLGRPDEAASAAREAQRIFANAGDRRGVARSMNLDGILLENQGDAVGAKQQYEQALTIYRDIGYKLGVADELDDLGDVSFSLGDLETSRRDYEDAMAIYREIGHEDGICLAKGALGPVLLTLGDDNGSLTVSREAIDICTRLGDRSKVAIALFNLGRALRLQGRTTEARNAESQSVSGFEAIGDKQSAARARLMIAQLLLDDGELQQAQVDSRNAANVFVREKAARDAALAYSVFSQAMLREGNLVGAQQAIDEAARFLSKCSDREAELIVAISAAQIQVVSGGLARDSAAKSFEEIASKANRLGFVPYELEPRLALAEIEVNVGDHATARSHLEALQKEAAERGFGLIALKAAGDLKNLSQNSARE